MSGLTYVIMRNVFFIASSLALVRSMDKRTEFRSWPSESQSHKRDSNNERSCSLPGRYGASSKRQYYQALVRKAFWYLSGEL